MDATSIQSLLKGSNRTLVSVKSLGLDAEENVEGEWSEETSGGIRQEVEDLTGMSPPTISVHVDETSTFIIRNIEKYVKCYVERKADDLLALREMIQGDKYIPSHITDEQLTLFFFTMQFDIPRTVALLRNNYKLRSNHPHLFSCRSVFAPLVQEVWNVLKVAVYPNRPQPKQHIIFVGLRDFDASHFKSAEALKLFFMCADVYYILEGLPKQIILIVNAEGASYSYITKENYQYLKVLVKYVQESMPYNVEAVHVMNTSTTVRNLFKFVRPFLSKAIINMIQFHEDFDITKFIPSRCVPSDLGGLASGTTLDYQDAFRQKFEMTQEFFDIEEEQRTTHNAN